MATCCITCNAAASQCNNKQSFCSGNSPQGRGQAANIYVGNPTFPSVVRDQIIFKQTPMAVWQAAAAWTSRAANYGSTRNSGGWSANTFTPSFLKASELNELIAGINSLGVTNVNFTAVRDEVIYASDIQKIYSSLNSLQLNPNACNMCNGGCNQCNTCMAQCCCDTN